MITDRELMVRWAGISVPIRRQVFQAWHNMLKSHANTIGQVSRFCEHQDERRDREDDPES
jgi:hypothetical protein